MTEFSLENRYQRKAIGDRKNIFVTNFRLSLFFDSFLLFWGEKRDMHCFKQYNKSVLISSLFSFNMEVNYYM